MICSITPISTYTKFNVHLVTTKKTKIYVPIDIKLLMHDPSDRKYLVVVQLYTKIVAETRHGQFLFYAIHCFERAQSENITPV